MPDQAMLLSTAAFSCGFLDALMASFSLAGNSGLIWLLATLFLLLDKRTRRQGMTLFFAVALTYVIGNVILKDLVMRPRPFQQYGVTDLLVPPPSGYSFPSGHASSSFAALAVLFATGKSARIPAAVCALLISFSRVYVFVHFPSDVLAGALLGCGCAYLAMALIRRFEVPRPLYPMDVT
ncbi:phosphatase PAP2 family protein [Christensenella tenuis]|jgi:undecaprenyl-diphosphatase|uniref:Phosphatase PAP2 family protein n=1 Tax=Christensenella tenuis TaxID=2763033 RepID=A0ABR7EHR0_9FIRM|nr:phosphatase PAP2 family protein [Christensenella tenuis]MBC5648906.1 phosphatase PAP2 family protein [Christensenella tenuis]